jgi:hypothetical protein
MNPFHVIRTFFKVKVNLSLCFNCLPHHEVVLGEWIYRSTHSLTSAFDGGEWSASCLRPLYPHWKSPCYSLDRRSGGPQSRSHAQRLIYNYHSVYNMTSQVASSFCFTINIFYAWSTSVTHTACPGLLFLYLLISLIYRDEYKLRRFCLLQVKRSVHFQTEFVLDVFTKLVVVEEKMHLYLNPYTLGERSFNVRLILHFSQTCMRARPVALVKTTAFHIKTHFEVKDWCLLAKH